MQHGQLVGLTRRLLLEAADLALDAEQVLDVVPDLVRDHVRLGEVAWRAKAAIELIEELEIEVDLAVTRAVERPHRALAHAARGARRAAEQHQRGFLVSPAQQRAPTSAARSWSM